MRKIDEIKQNFLINSEDTGRFLVKSLKSGKTYFVEAIGDPHLEWGSLDPATKDLTNKKVLDKISSIIDGEAREITPDAKKIEMKDVNPPK